MDGAEPAGGRWNYDHSNRARPPKADRLPVAPAWTAQEDDIDAEVRADLDRWEAAGEVSFVGADGPRWAPATVAEAQQALQWFIIERLPAFGPWQDAMLTDDPAMAHSVLSPALNLGLLDPLDCVRAAEDAYRRGTAPLESVEGYTRLIIGWRDYVWGLYWHLGADYRTRNALGAQHPVPAWMADLDADAVTARCLRSVLAELRERGWVHHIPRLMVLGNWFLQRGVDPAAVTAWFLA